jgi:hypothetical protein
MLMQHAIAFDVVRERERHTLGHAAEYDGRARDATRRVAPELVDERLRRLAYLHPNLVHDLLALAPGQHEERDGEGDQQGEPAPVEELGRGRGEEERVEGEKAAVDRLTNEYQLVILDNVDVPDWLVKKPNCIHFTGQPTHGRAGFFPSLSGQQPV